MATSFSSFRAPIVSSSAPRKPAASCKAAGAANGWWAPLFGWSSQPDYISIQKSTDPDREVSGESGRIKPDPSFFKGCFTEEKAKELRRKTTETSTFHDVMYHSAIAARLASDLSGRCDR
ncbi:hypothetical protein CDL12_24201 [Handroanthus impetiginosus]|uniref:Uncharacterized protein n=1 Tax=Handroanthus impetiginosus TaxID=429701 RepID=A0A2G9GDC3_9LAMI|nr:hypothetical protein CDL12_24201 [Handroanthus impetiginosus]